LNKIVITFRQLRAVGVKAKGFLAQPTKLIASPSPNLIQHDSQREFGCFTYDNIIRIAIHKCCLAIFNFPLAFH